MPFSHAFGGRCILPIQIGQVLPRGFLQIVVTDDVVPIKNAPGLVALHLHCHSSRKPDWFAVLPRDEKGTLIFNGILENAS